jgi:Pyruvate/2-oxoacid:ferredoxin oxidoreductase delta subunit
MISTANVRKLTVVVSRGQSRSPEKRALENAILDAVGGLGEVVPMSIPHIYDLRPQGDTIPKLREIDGDIVFLSWVFPRAARWVLDRHGISGHAGEVELRDADQDDSDQGSTEATEATENPLVDRVIDSRDLPDRKIYCLDLRHAEDPEVFAKEIERIASHQPGKLYLRDSGELSAIEQIEPLRTDDGTTRRWYPVIDYSRCTNCMECIDFCLFGVYGVDDVETILVEQPDNCRKGCPACSRVCPENAIIFPQHKTPAIAGADTDDGTGLKIDLSLLFGAPDQNEDPIAAAARERDEQLLLTGRAAVGMEVGIPKRHLEKPGGPKDDLDALIDALDEMEL